MPTASEADLIRRNQALHQQTDAARAELSREAEANRLLQEELKVLRAGMNRVANWIAATNPTADDIIAAINRSNDAHSKDLVNRTAERNVLRRAFEHLRGMIEGIVDTDDLLALRDTVGETCNEVGLRSGYNHESGEPDYQWVAVT